MRPGSGSHRARDNSVVLDGLNDLAEGMGRNAVAAKYGVAPKTVSRWIASPELYKGHCQKAIIPQPSSSKIPEDQQQAFIKGVFDEGRSKVEVYTEITGKSTKPRNRLPDQWDALYSQEIGRREALSELQQQLPAQHQCTCPQCGNVHIPRGRE